jgi:hypothetical protein
MAKEQENWALDHSEEESEEAPIEDFSKVSAPPETQPIQSN